MNTQERAKQYFDALGINPYVKGPLYKEGLLDKPPIPETNTLEQEVCIVSISCIIFFTYVEVSFLVRNCFKSDIFSPLAPSFLIASDSICLTRTKLTPSLSAISRKVIGTLSFFSTAKIVQFKSPSYSIQYLHSFLVQGNLYFECNL